MASISTNKQDYAPGETVEITGIDFSMGHLVEFTIINLGADGVQGTADDFAYASWTALVDSNGNILTTWGVPQDALNRTLVLVANEDTDGDGVFGGAGDISATTTFTDAGPSITVNQWETKSNGGAGQWANGQANTNQTLYFEGELVPYSADLGNLTAGSTYGIRINLDYYQANTDSGGFLQLGTYNADIPLTPTGNDNFGPPSPAGLDSTFTITALDGFAHDAFSFYTANADVLSVTYSLSANGLTRYADVVFKATSSSQNSELYWGQQLATPNQVVTSADTTPLNGTDGAAGFTGGSLQTKIEGSGASGAEWITPSNAVQLMPGTVVRGTIAGYKWLDSDGDATWDSTEQGHNGTTIQLWLDDGDGIFEPGTGDTLEGVQITANGGPDLTGNNGNPDGIPDTINPGYYEFSSATGFTLTRGETYFVREVVEAGYTQTYPTPNQHGPLGITQTTPRYIGDYGQTESPNFGNRQSIDLSVIKSDAPGATVVGGTLTAGADTDPLLVPGLTGYNTFTYTILAKNNSTTASASNVIVTDTLDSDLTYVANSASNGGTFSAGVVTWNLGTLAAGEERILTFQVRVNDNASPNQDPDLLNTVTITSSTPDSNPTNNTNTEPTEIISFDTAAHLVINKETQDMGTVASGDEGNPGDGISVLAGDGIRWSYTVTNDGLVTLTNITVKDDNGTATTADDVVVGSIASLAVGASATLYLTGTAAAGSYSNIGTASVTANGQTVSATDDSSYFGADAQIAIDKKTQDVSAPAGTAGDNIQVLAGDSVKWIYTVTNAGNVALSDVQVSDDQLGDIDANANTVLTKTGGDQDSLLESGETWTYELVGTAAAGSYSNTGTASGSYTDPAGHTATDTATDDSSYFGANPQITIDKRTFDGTGLTAGSVATAFGSAGDGRNILSTEAITWIYAVKRDSTGNVDLSNVTVSDSESGVTPTLLAKVGGDADDILEAGETWYYTAAGTAVVGDYSNTGTASGSYTDSAGHTATDTATDDSSYFGANPKIDVEKYVWVGQYEADGVTKIWVDADSPTGPTLLATSGINPQFKFVVVNTGNVDLNNVQLSDSVFDLNGAAAGTAITIGDLAKGDGIAGGADTYEFIYTGATWQYGQHANTATAGGTYEDDASHLTTTTDTDKAHYFGTYGGFVTNSALCTFDTNTNLPGNQFNLLFTPNFQAANGDYKLSDSNPGQFYYNVFSNGTAGQTQTFTFEIPRPFDATVAVPIHVYSSVEVKIINGQVCLVPGTEIANFKLSDLMANGAITDKDNDGNLEYTFSVNVPTSGFIYANMHLDFGLEKQSGWVKSSPASGTDNAIDDPNVPGTQQSILDNTAYEFNAYLNGTGTTLGDLINGSQNTVYNDNIFKTIKGVGGLFQSDLSSTGGLDETAVQGQKIVILKASDNSVQGKATTDVDGWYFAQFLATGSKTTYKAIWDQDGDGNYLEDMTANRFKTFDMGGSAGKWVEANFTVVDPQGYAPPSDFVIDSFSGFLV